MHSPLIGFADDILIVVFIILCNFSCSCWECGDGGGIIGVVRVLFLFLLGVY